MNVNRRQLLAAIGTASAGTAVVTGTGAFTSVAADRDVTVQVEGDAQAYLAMRPTGPNKQYVTTENNQIGFDFTDNNTTNNGGKGVNADAATLFLELLEVQNQGTQEVTVEATPLLFTQSGQNVLAVVFAPSNPNPATFPKVTVDPGNTVKYSAIVAEFSPGNSNLSISDTVTFYAEATQ